MDFEDRYILSLPQLIAIWQDVLSRYRQEPDRQQLLMQELKTVFTAALTDA